MLQEVYIPKYKDDHVQARKQPATWEDRADAVRQVMQQRKARCLAEASNSCAVFGRCQNVKRRASATLRLQNARWTKA